MNNEKLEIIIDGANIASTMIVELEHLMRMEKK
jgi:hypothetical protein